MSQSIASLTSIVDACTAQLDRLDESKSFPKPSYSRPLNQLLVDLGSVFDEETGVTDKRKCYRDETVSDGYNGPYYRMVKTLLDSYDPDAYTTPEALGVRIFTNY